jgi:2,4-dienoyl-CoA reductase-like NADH-dependent reductase (Old Yellow Enzyme family)
MSRLFDPWQIGELRLANRIIIAPMCQYSADEGSATDWHLIHLGHLALSGAALLIVEATRSRPRPDHADRPRPLQRRQRAALARC